MFVKDASIKVRQFMVNSLHPNQLWIPVRVSFCCTKMLIWTNKLEDMDEKTSGVEDTQQKIDSMTE